MPTNSVNLATYKAVKASKAVGSATQPIYIDSDGTFAACTEQSSSSTWATARTFTIGDTGKSVDGSADVSWSLSEIGAAASSHTHTNIVLSTANLAFTSTNTAAVNGINVRWYSTADTFSGQPSQWGFLVTVAGDDNSSENHQFFIEQSNGSIYHRGTNASSYTSPPAFKTILDSNNYTSYTVTKTGSGASGTWGISISGNAATATKATQDGSGNVITSKYVTIDTTQTITGTKSFGASGAGCQINGAGSNGGINSIRIGDDVWLGDCNASGIMGMKSTGNNCGFYFYNSAGTLIGYFQSINGSYFQTDRKFYIPNTGSSWIDGQRYQNAAINVHTINNTGSYFPWVNQINNGSARWFSFGILNQAFYLIGSATSRTTNGYDYGLSFNVVNGYLQGASRVYSAVWNDYAEFRKADIDTPGYVVVPSITGVATLATERLQAGGRVISDTYGNAVGQCDEAQTPVGLAGRVLAYPYRDKSEYHIGDAVCTAPNGTVDIMTREEICRYPDRILGIVNEIPTYKVWEQTFTDSEGATQQTHSVEVKGRIWIDIK